MKNLLLTFLFSSATAFLWGQSITSVGAPFNSGDPMVFDYAGGTGATTDWIGIYSVGEVPDGDPASYTWQYITTASGQVIFADPLPNNGGATLPNGDYTAHLFCCDGYDILASVNFSVVGAAPPTVNATTFPKVGQPITFEYSGGTGADTDWIGIYSPGAVPGIDGSLVFVYIVPGTVEGEVVVDLSGSPLPAGDYDVHFFCCDDYNILASYALTIYEDLAPSLAVVGTPTENLPLTFEFTGGSGSQLDWVGIYPHDTVPDGDPTSIAYLYVNGANGAVTFDPPPVLVPGTFYDAHLFEDDGYGILASYTNWTVIVTATGEVELVKPVFSAQPSPAHEVVRLVFTERLEGNLTFFNMVGQAVRSQEVNGEETLEVRGIQPGNYAVQFQGEKGSQVIKVVVE